MGMLDCSVEVQQCCDTLLLSQLYFPIHWDIFKKIYVTKIRRLVACNHYCTIRQRFVLVDLRGKNVVKRAVSICSNGYVEIYIRIGPDLLI